MIEATCLALIWDHFKFHFKNFLLGGRICLPISVLIENCYDHPIESELQREFGQINLLSHNTPKSIHRCLRLAHTQVWFNVVIKHYTCLHILLFFFNISFFQKQVVLNFGLQFQIPPVSIS